PGNSRCITVERCDRDVRREGLQRTKLILGKRLRREQEKKARPAGFERHLNRGKRIAERLTAGGRRRDDGVSAAPDRVDSLRLMDVKAPDSAKPQPVEQARVYRPLEGLITAFFRRNVLDVDDLPVVVAGSQQILEELGRRAHSMCSNSV